MTYSPVVYILLMAFAFLTVYSLFWSIAFVVRASIRYSKGQSNASEVNIGACLFLLFVVAATGLISGVQFTGVI